MIKRGFMNEKKKSNVNITIVSNIFDFCRLYDSHLNRCDEKIPSEYFRKNNCNLKYMEQTDTARI